MICTHYTNGHCNVAKQLLAREEAPVTEKQCTVCQKHPRPMQLNKVTADIALYLERDKDKKANLLRRLMPVLNQDKLVHAEAEKRHKLGGPGTELKKLFHSLGARACGNCIATGNKMDEMGSAWCREHVDELAQEIHNNSQKRGWMAVLSRTVTLVGIEGPVLRWAILRACELSEKGS